MAIADIIGSGFKRKGYEVQNDPVGSLFHMLDYKRTHLWLLEIDGLFSCTMQSAERPKLNLGDSKKVKYINTYEKLQSGTPEWMPISVVVTDPITPSTSIELYEKIRDKFWNYKTGKTGYPADYKFSKPLKSFPILVFSILAKNCTSSMMSRSYWRYFSLKDWTFPA